MSQSEHPSHFFILYTEMCIFNKSVVLVILTLTLAKSERWYSATVVQRRDGDSALFDSDIFNNSKVIETQMAPILSQHLQEPKNKRNNKSVVEIFNNITPTDRNLIFNRFKTSEAIEIRHNSNVTNANKLRKNPPKRKYIRRKYSIMKPRQTKMLNTKQLRKSKFLEVFNVVEFDHVSCISTSGLEGMCLPDYDCINSGGSAMGTCADGYGVCCVSQFRCNERSNAPMGWFTNPEFPLPSTQTLSCVFSLDKSSEDITQIRLDFNIFEVLPPTYGVCQDDQFIVSGQNLNNLIPIVCGINTGQHIYIEVSDVDGPINLTFQSASSENRLFSIQVTQLTRSDELAAIPGCLQYFKQDQGYIESFNYRDRSDIVIRKNPSYFNNLNYAICIERAPETCSVTYTNAGSMQIVNYDIDGLPVIPPDQAGVEILNCPSDWLLIAATRLCGDRLNDGSIFQDFTINAPITDNSAGPIVVWFRSDESYVGNGFKIFYQQNPCSA